MTRPPTSPAVSGWTPAKLNLGLAVTGRRTDGYHDLVTIFQSVSIWDRLTMTPAPALTVSCDDLSLPDADNLVQRALAALRDRTGTVAGAHVSLEKTIPVAAGLGGASSDAAAALRLARQLWRVNLADHLVVDLARQLGSDVPFFLHGGTALATGRGDALTPLPLPRATWFVVVAPLISIPRKTATLYAALSPQDFTDGAPVLAQAAHLGAGKNLDPVLLPNAFARALYQLRPALAELPPLMRRLGASNVALSGAGPSHYAVFADPTAAEQVRANLAAALQATARVFVATPVAAHQQDPPLPGRCGSATDRVRSTYG